ncbi:hypothetical protein G9A89_000657 [Geosiphon pyriformis]|nr:hypothetical protein G9A89_000657 [Geosiphon pyriformis]
MTAEKLTNDHGIMINTNLKHPVNNHTNQAIVLKEIPVRTSIKAMRVAVSVFGQIKMIKIQLLILIGKDAIYVARANIDKQTWDIRNKFRTLLYTLPMGTMAHNFEKTCLIECNSVNYTRA